MSDKNNPFDAVMRIWLERFDECSRTGMTSEFVNSVWRFYRSLYNLGEGELAIKDKVDEFIEKKWKPELEKIVEYKTRHTTDEDVHNFERNYAEAEHIHELFTYIIQTIHNSGLNWPSSENMESFSHKEDE